MLYSKEFFLNTNQYRENEWLHCQTCSDMVVPQFFKSKLTAQNWGADVLFSQNGMSQSTSQGEQESKHKLQLRCWVASQSSSVYEVLKFPFLPRRCDILLNIEREPHHSDSDWHFGLYLRLNKAEQIFELGSCLISEYQSCWIYPSGKLGSPNFWLRYWLDHAVLRVLAWRE